MVYELTSIKEVIARLYSDFNVDYAGWIPSSGLWIADGLDALGIYMTLEKARQEDTVENYRAKVPCNTDTLLAIEYCGCRLIRNGMAIAKTGPCDAPDRYHATARYDINGGFINTTFEKGDIVFHFLRLPVEQEKDTGLIVPLIPKDSIVINALAWRILWKMCATGYKHPVYKLGASRAHLDPYHMWQASIPEASQSIGTLDEDERNLHRNLWGSMLINPNAFLNTAFDNTKTTS